jgi:8-oxo-dGTP pyrophosphatase MutT (NUDIX family)
LHIDVTDLENIRDRLSAHEPALNEDVQSRAAVALVLLPPLQPTAGPRVLLIRRSRAEGDPWSGHLAFPGGRVDPSDGGPQHAAERETLEEVALDLSAAECLGRLDDLAGRAIPIVVSAFVYALEGEPALEFSHEVAAAGWVSFADLLDPARHVTERFDYQRHELEVPAIALGIGDGPPLWGLTYRFLELFLARLGAPLPEMPWREDL